MDSSFNVCFGGGSSETPKELQKSGLQKFVVVRDKPGFIGFLYRLFRSKRGFETFSFLGLVKNVAVKESEDSSVLSCSIEVMSGTVKKED